MKSLSPMKKKLVREWASYSDKLKKSVLLNLVLQHLLQYYYEPSKLTFYSNSSAIKETKARKRWRKGTNKVLNKFRELGYIG